RAIARSQPTQPVPARVTEAARPVIVERVVAAHLAIDVDLQAGLLNAAAGTPVHPREAPAAGDLPSLVVGVVIRPEVHVRRDGDIPHAPDTIGVFPRDHGGRVNVDAVAERGGSNPCADLADRAE